MKPERMEALIDLLAPDEIREGLFLLGVAQRWENMPQAEADEWRRRIIARQEFLALDEGTQVRG